MSAHTVQATGVQCIRLFTIWASFARDAVGTMLANRDAVRHLVDAWLTHALAACSASRARFAAVMSSSGPSAVRTHVAVDEVVGKASKWCARPIDSVSARLTRNSRWAVATSCAEVAIRAVGIGCSTGAAV